MMRIVNVVVKCAVALLIGAVVVVLALKPVGDPDFFWHLKSGEWIWEHRAFPRQDPFAFTTPPVLDPLQRYSLVYSWLSQVLFHLFFRAGGMAGIILLRVILMALLLAGVYRRRQGEPLLAGGLLLLYLAILVRVPVERPQFFSVIGFAWLLVILDGLRRGSAGPGRRAAGFLPLFLLMVLWANLHAGVVLGQGVILLFLAAEGVKRLHLAPRQRSSPDIRTSIPEQESGGRYRDLLLAGTGGLLGSLVSPLTWHGYLLLGSAAGTVPFNLEYVSAYRAYTEFNDTRILVFGLVLFLTAAGFLLIRRKQVDLTEVLLLAVVGCFACLHIRYILFFPVAAFPFLGRAFGREGSGRLVRAGILAAAVLVGGQSAWDARGNVRRPSRETWINSFQYPTAAAAFIERENLQGEMYNNFSWGGYLIWRLGPRRRVFIDGRVMNKEAYRQAMAIDAAAPGWQDVLASWRVGYVVSPFAVAPGEVYPLIGALVQSPDWVPVFLRESSVIFVRDIEGNRAVISRYGIPKARFVAGLLVICDRLIAARPGDVMPRLVRGDVLLRMNRLEEAREEYLRAQALAPFNPVAREKLELVARLRRGS